MAPPNLALMYHVHDDLPITLRIKISKKEGDIVFEFPSVRPSFRPSRPVRPSRFLSGVILQNYKTQFHETWWKGSTVIGDAHIINPSIFGNFSWSYGPL